MTEQRSRCCGYKVYADRYQDDAETYGTRWMCGKCDCPCSIQRQADVSFPRIKQAAIKLASGEVLTLPRPYRHSDLFLQAEAKGELIGHIQGFVTEDDIFVDREKAFEIARAARQLVGQNELQRSYCVLYTEDLW